MFQAIVVVLGMKIIDCFEYSLWRVGVGCEFNGGI